MFAAAIAGILPQAPLVLRMAVMDPVASAALGEPYPSISARRLEQPQALLGVMPIGYDQRLGDQLQHVIDDLSLRAGGMGRGRRCVLKREATCKYRGLRDDGKSCRAIDSLNQERDASATRMRPGTQAICARS